MNSLSIHSFRATARAAALALVGALVSAQGSAPAAGEPGGPGLALRSSKILTCAKEGPQFVNNGVVLVRDGKIERVGRAADVAVPDGYELVDVGEKWIMPGLIDLHCHVGGTFDINDMVYLTNPGCRASTAVIPANPALERAIAGGVTTVLFIPGSGTNIGGQGILFKTGHEHFEDAVLRDPGSMKLAQAGNPERFGWGIGRAFMNWNTRNTFMRGIAYAKKWEAYEQDETAEKPEVDPQFEIIRALRRGDCHISAHTQIYQVSLMSVQMVKETLGLPIFIDHGTFDSWRHAKITNDAGVAAILGPRSIDVPTRGFIRWSGSNPERIQGVVAGYQQAGHELIGFNTDSPVIPQEELQLQASMGVRYGFDDSKLDTVRGLTIVPAIAAGIESRVGSIEAGKDADLLVVTGHIADPRTSVEQVFVDGVKHYDTKEDVRRW